MLENKSLLKDIKIVSDTEEKNSESGKGDGSGEEKAEKTLSKIQDPTEIRKLVNQIKALQDPLVSAKSKVNLSQGTRLKLSHLK